MIPRGDGVDDTADVLLKLLRRLQEEGVRYILVGGHAVRLNGFLRSTEDIDLLLPSSIENGRRVIRAATPTSRKTSGSPTSCWSTCSLPPTGRLSSRCSRTCAR